MIALNGATSPNEKAATHITDLLMQNSLGAGCDPTCAAHMIINATRVTPIFTSFVCYWNYPELTYYKPTAAPAMQSAEARGEHIKKIPGTLP